MTAIILDLSPVIKLTDEQFYQLCQANRDLKLERTAVGELIANGLRLGWLLDPQNQRVEIYRVGQEVEIQYSPGSLSGKDVLPGFYTYSHADLVNLNRSGSHRCSSYLAANWKP